MYRIDTDGSVASLPTPAAVGTEGYFSEGDPGSGQQATVVSADWLNAVQEEICNVIEQAGLATDKEDNTLLYDAIMDLIEANPPSYVGRRMNHLYNGAFEVWQRGTSTTAANGVSKYLADRWYVTNGLGTNGVLTYSRVAGSSDGSKYGAQVQITTAPTAAQANGCSLFQTLENFDSLRLYNKTVCFSVRIKALGNVNSIGISLMSKSSEAKVDTLIGSETTASVNSSGFTLVKIEAQAMGTGMGTGGVVGVRIRINGVSSGNAYDLNNGFIVEQAMLHIGTTAVEFTPRFASFAEELKACERYYEKSWAYGTDPGTGTLTGAVISSGPPGAFSIIGGGRYPASEVNIRMGVRKRTTPTVTPYSTDGTVDNIRDGTSAANHSAAAEVVSDTAFSITTGGGITDGEEVAFHWVADAEI